MELYEIKYYIVNGASYVQILDCIWSSMSAKTRLCMRSKPRLCMDF